MEDGLEGPARPRDVLDTSEAGGLLIRGSVVRFAGFVAGVGLTVTSAALVLRHLGPVDAGRYATITSLLAIVAGLADAGTTNIAVREYAQRHGDERSQAMRDIVGLRVCLALGGVAFATAFAVMAGYSDAMVLGAVLGGAGLVVQVVQTSFVVPLNAELQLGRSALVEFVRTAGLAITLGLLVAAGAGLAALLSAPIAAAVVALAVSVPLARGRMPVRPSFHVQRWLELMRDTLPYAAATAVGVIYAYVTVIVLEQVSTEAEVGIFSAGFRVFVVLTAVPGILVAGAFPILARAARDDRERLRYALQRLLDTALVGGGLVAVGTISAASTAIAVIAGAEFAAADPVLRIQGIAIFLTFLVAFTGFALLALRRHAVLLAGSAAALLVSSTMTVLLGKGSGAQGAAWANVAGEATLVAVCFAGMVRGEDAPRLTPGPLLPVLLAAGLGLGTAVLMESGGIVEPVAALAACAVYVVALLVMRAVPEELLVAAREAAQRLRR